VALRSTVPQRAIPRDQQAVSKALTAAVAVALVFGLVGVVFLGLMLRERKTTAAGSVSAGGLTLQVQSAQWIDLEHDHEDGFQMPQQMTPGAPGPNQQRLAVEVTLENHSDSIRQFTQSEFAIEGPDGEISPMVSEDLSDKLLRPGLGLSGSLSFDLPASSAKQGNPRFFLVWDRAGEVVRVPVTVGAASHTHN
jgi:hypothetical protein